MAKRVRQKTVILEQLGKFMLEQGGVMDKVQYMEAKETPVRYSFIHTYFGTWGRMLSLLQTHNPELWAKILAGKPEVKPEAKKEAVKAPVAKPTEKPKAK